MKIKKKRENIKNDLAKLACLLVSHPHAEFYSGMKTWVENLNQTSLHQMCHQAILVLHKGVILSHGGGVQPTTPPAAASSTKTTSFIPHVTLVKMSSTDDLEAFVKLFMHAADAWGWPFFSPIPLLLRQCIPLLPFSSQRGNLPCPPGLVQSPGRFAESGGKPGISKISVPSQNWET